MVELKESSGGFSWATRSSVLSDLAVVSDLDDEEEPEVEEEEQIEMVSLLLVAEAGVIETRGGGCLAGVVSIELISLVDIMETPGD